MPNDTTSRPETPATRPIGAMRVSRPIGWFMVVFGIWSLVIWPTFMVNISEDPRSWGPTGGMTAFFTVHLVIAVVSFICGVAFGIIGVRAMLAFRRSATARD
jgi:hypothetical protein